jgi:hypothetical protein
MAGAFASLRGETSRRAASKVEENGQKQKGPGRRPGMPDSFLKHLNNPDHKLLHLDTAPYN